MTTSIDFTDELGRRLAAAKHVVASTGAGASAESGVPTFRDLEGYWSRYSPEELATQAALVRNPILVQSWYAERANRLKSIVPNPCHNSLVEMEEIFPRFDLITQNVDNLHQEAGSTNVVELHGNVRRFYCSECGSDRKNAMPDEIETAVCCEACGGLIRPDVVWFGEILPQENIRYACEAARACDVFLSIGTSSVVYPAAGLAEIAGSSGAFCVEVNIEGSAAAAIMDELCIGPAGRILPALAKLAKTVRRANTKS